MFEEYIVKYGIPANVISGMFNATRKLSFIVAQYGNQKQDSIEVIARFFNQIGNIENEKGKDLLEFNIVEIESIFKTLRISVRGTFNNRKNIIRKYFEWGARRKYISLEAIDKFSNIMFDHIFDQNNLKLKYFKDLNDLINCLNTVIAVNESDDIHKYDTILCAVFLIWCGLPLNDICKLKIKDIDLNQGFAKLDKIYIIPKFICDFISKYLEITSYSGIKKGHMGKVYFYKDTGYVLRTTVNSSITCYSENGLQSRVSTWFTKKIVDVNENSQYYEHTLYLKDVRDSGFFVRLYEYEQKNNISIKDIDKTTFLKLKYFDDITDQNMANYIDIYTLWKQTFYGV